MVEKIDSFHKLANKAAAVVTAGRIVAAVSSFFFFFESPLLSRDLLATDDSLRTFQPVDETSERPTRLTNKLFFLFSFGPSQRVGRLYQDSRTRRSLTQMIRLFR